MDDSQITGAASSYARKYALNTDILETQKRKQIAEYHRFSKEMGIRPKDNRLRVVKRQW